MIIYIGILHGDEVAGDTELIKISISPMETIAALKDKYMESGNCPTTHSITLKFRGQILKDEKLLKEYNIGQEDTVYHISGSMTSYSTMNYHQLSEHLKSEAQLTGDYRHAGYSAEDSTLWNSDWKKGDEWKAYPPVLVHDLEERNHNALISSPPLKPSVIPTMYTSRQLYKTYICKVNGFSYSLYHKMEGRWNGTVTMSQSGKTAVRICSTFISFNSLGYWEEKQSVTASDGTTTITELKLKPFENKILKIDTTDPRYSKCFNTLLEQNESLIIIQYLDRGTGQSLLIETINYIDDYQRVRVRQRYSKNGELNGIDTIQEQRVIDSVSGAVEKFGTFSL